MTLPQRRRGRLHRPRRRSARRSCPLVARRLQRDGQEQRAELAASPRARTPQKIDNLFMPILIIAIVVGIFIIVATVYVARQVPLPRRARTRTRSRSTATPALEIGWTIVPALILAVIAVPTVATIFDLAEDPGPNALQVTVVGKQWWWQFEYPERQGRHRRRAASSPTGRDVYLKLTACDGRGDRRLQRDPQLLGARSSRARRTSCPATTNHLTIEADKPGTFLGQCAEYCGLSHANMRFRVIAKTADDFEEWLSEQQQGPVNPLTTTVADGKHGPRARPRSSSSTRSSARTATPSTTRRKPTLRPEPHPPRQPHHLRQRHVPAEPRRTSSTGCMNAPSMIPMESRGLPAATGVDGHCVGMPSFTENTPPGPADDDRSSRPRPIADFLLEQK